MEDAREIFIVIGALFSLAVILFFWLVVGYVIWLETTRLVRNYRRARNMDKTFREFEEAREALRKKKEQEARDQDTIDKSTEYRDDFE